MITLHKIKPLHWILIPVVVSLVGFLTFLPCLNSPLTVEDEYIMMTANTINPELKGQILLQLISFHDQFLVFLGRFAPATIGSYFVKAKLFGVNPFAFHMTILLTWIVSGTLFGYILMMAFGNFATAISISLVYLTLPASSEIAVRLCSGESLGNLFLLASVFIILLGVTRNKFFTGLLFISNLMMCWSKENYFAMLPVLAFVQIILRCDFSPDQIFNEIKKQLKNLILSYALPVILTAVGIYIAIKSSGRVFNYGMPWPIYKVMLNNLWMWVKWLMPFLPVIMISLFALKKYTFSRTNFFVLLLIIILGMGGQWMMYYKYIVSYSQGRYHMPAILPILFSLAACISLLSYLKLPWRILAFGILFMLIINQMKTSYINAGAYYSKAKNFNHQIEYVVKNKPQKIAVYGGFEYLYSLKAQLNYWGFVPSVIYVRNLKDPNESKGINNDAFKKELELLLSKDFEIVDLHQAKADTSLHCMLTGFPSEPARTFPNLDILQSCFTSMLIYQDDFFNSSWGDLIRGNINRREAVRFYIFTK
ncbi:MAG: hypothetical protein ACK5JC_07905 [Bacteroidota bacterium]|jgi:hypothetical protein